MLIYQNVNVCNRVINMSKFICVIIVIIGFINLVIKLKNQIRIKINRYFVVINVLRRFNLSMEFEFRNYKDHFIKSHYKIDFIN